jgi:mitochondrial fission protein ELM1
LSNRRGDNNQLFALANELGFPFEAKDLRFSQLRKIPLLHGSGLAILAAASRRLVQPPWPDLVISAGYPAVPVARYIRGASGGSTKLVHIGNARTDISDFDLHITTPQYPSPPIENVLELPFPIGNPATKVQPTREEREWLHTYPRPRRLVAVGGPARHWELDHGALERAIQILREKKPEGSIIVATSPRTRASSCRFLKEKISGAMETLVSDFPRFAVLLSEADEIHVTADSVSMTSEAVLTGKPVGLVPIRRSLRGQVAHWLWEPLGRAMLPNFRNFWDLLREERLAGTVELPVASQVCDTEGRAAVAVRSLLAPGDAVDEGTERADPDLGPPRRSSRRQ